VIGHDTITPHFAIPAHQSVDLVVRVGIANLGAANVVIGASGVSCY
jgi:hypothetical protein